MVASLGGESRVALGLLCCCLWVAPLVEGFGVLSPMSGSSRGAAGKAGSSTAAEARRSAATRLVGSFDSSKGRRRIVAGGRGAWGQQQSLTVRYAGSKGGGGGAKKKRRRKRVPEGGAASKAAPPSSPKAATGQGNVDENEVPQQGVLLPPTTDDMSKAGETFEEEEENPFAALGANYTPSRPLVAGEGIDLAGVKQQQKGGGEGQEGGKKKKEGGVKRTNKYAFDLDIELPVESENIGESDFNARSPFASAGPATEEREKGAARADGVMPLPDIKDLQAKSAKKKEVKASATPKTKVRRDDIAAFTKLLEQDPEADGDDLFETEEYDFIASILGEGTTTFLGIPNSFLQSGHTVLLFLCLLCGFVSYPGFPLTELPFEIREFLQKGLGVVYAINILMAPLAFIKARELRQPAAFWAFKTLILGGVGYNELCGIKSVVDDIEASGGTKGRRRGKGSKRRRS